MIWITGIGGQLSHDVMNELAARRIAAVGSDIARYREPKEILSAAS